MTFFEIFIIIVCSLIVIGVFAKMIIDKKKGKPCCGCGDCHNCSCCNKINLKK